ncbi:helix-turn-helix domain-containing protein [Halobaculum sp. MBLA0147]|uniref:helix-turn-helix domain-containing protein n=1 Tax=Halobaculum sp. MBLA0147 TaxID=3079934 RepID=UPI0035265F2C
MCASHGPAASRDGERADVESARRDATGVGVEGVPSDATGVGTERASSGSRPETASEVVRSESDDCAAAAVDAVSDGDCRQLLAAATDDPRSASELADACGVALSTAYRKLDRLVEAGLLEQGTRVSTVGRHPTVYTRVTRRVTVTVADDGRLTVERHRSN